MVRCQRDGTHDIQKAISVTRATNSRFILSDHDKVNFRENGFVPLRNFLSLKFVDHIRSRIKHVMRLLDENQRGFKRVGYDILEQDEFVEALLAEHVFSDTLTQLTGCSLFLTQGVGFELEKNKHHGFPWHIGTQSFGYQRANDYGCSLWVPLAPVVNAKQGGGMSYVPEHIISGKFMYEYIDPAIDQSLLILAEESEELTIQEFSELRHGILNSPAMITLLECHRRCDDFDLGDALFFNKNVIHASEPLRDGELESRCAFVMRFISLDSRYDKKRAFGLEFPRSYFGHVPQSNFHIEVCKNDGDLICKSDYFTAPKKRVLKLTSRQVRPT